MNPNLIRNSVVGLAGVSLTLTAVIIGTRVTSASDDTEPTTDSTASTLVVDDAAAPLGVEIAFEDATIVVPASDGAGTHDSDDHDNTPQSEDHGTGHSHSGDATAETDEPGADVEGAGEEPVTEEPVTEEPATEEPATEEPATEEPGTEEPATEDPAEEPAEEDPADDGGTFVDPSWLADWLAENGIDFDQSWLDGLTDDSEDDGPVLDIDGLVTDPLFCNWFPELCEPDIWEDILDGPIVQIDPCDLIPCGPLTEYEPNFELADDLFAPTTPSLVTTPRLRLP
jgi:hypothetical protein